MYGHGGDLCNHDSAESICDGSVNSIEGEDNFFLIGLEYFEGGFLILLNDVDFLGVLFFGVVGLVLLDFDVCHAKDFNYYF